MSHNWGTNERLNLKLVGERDGEDNFRVGGVAEESAGRELNRDNWNVPPNHTWVVAPSQLNALVFQLGRKQFDQPTNPQAMAECFS